MNGEDRMSCLKCGGALKLVDVEDRETGHKGYALECKVCEYLDFNDKQYRIIEIDDEKLIGLCLLPALCNLGLVLLK